MLEQLSKYRRPAPAAAKDHDMSAHDGLRQRDRGFRIGKDNTIGSSPRTSIEILSSSISRIV
jgi:hypothetical protein